VKLVMLPLRFHPRVKDRAAALVEPIAQDGDLSASRVTLASVLRMALLRGLESLEETYGVKP
jgi:hypothetical protein